MVRASFRSGKGLAAARLHARACPPRDDSAASRRAVLSALLPFFAAAPASAAGVPQVVPFLKGSGARGFFADEEEQLLRKREDAEMQAREQLEKERDQFEKEARKNQRGLCATPFGVDIVGITELVALVGAIVGGLAARQRKREAERLNEQLRKINLQLRQQARAGTMYAPGLSYAPQVSSLSVKPGSGGNGTDPGAAAGGGGHADAAANGSAVATTGATATLTKPPATEEAVSSAPAQALSTVDEEMTQEQQSCRETMREGKRLLRNGQGGSAIVRFEKALLMSQNIGDKMLQRRATRGMAASSRMQGNSQSAIKYLKQVLELSEQMQEFTGDADAYGSIADIYADMGDFDEAAKYYDQYIGRMQTDGAPV